MHDTECDLDFCTSCLPVGQGQWHVIPLSQKPPIQQEPAIKPLRIDCNPWKKAIRDSSVSEVKQSSEGLKKQA